MTRAGEPPFVDVDVTDLSAFELPLDAFCPTAEQRRLLGRARLVLLAGCLTRHGFPIALPDPLAPLPFGRNEMRYGLTDLDRARRSGYHVPELTDRSARLESLVPAEADQIADECLAAAMRRLAAGCGESVDLTLPDRLSLQLFQVSAGDSRVRRVFREWSEAMAARGFDYDSPRSANNDPAFATPELTAREIAVAEADVACKQQVGVIPVWAGVETAYQLRAVEQHAAALAACRVALHCRIANAIRILDGVC